MFLDLCIVPSLDWRITRRWNDECSENKKRSEGNETHFQYILTKVAVIQYFALITLELQFKESAVVLSISEAKSLSVGWNSVLAHTQNVSSVLINSKRRLILLKFSSLYVISNKVIVSNCWLLFRRAALKYISRIIISYPFCYIACSLAKTEAS